MSCDTIVVSKLEQAALYRMLIRRATLIDRLRAWRKKGHWLNCARYEANQLDPRTLERRLWDWANR